MSKKNPVKNSKKEPKKYEYDKGEGWIYIGKKPGLFHLNRSEKKWVPMYLVLQDNIFRVYKTDRKKKQKYELNLKDAIFLDTVQRKNRHCSIRIVPKLKHKGRKQKPIYVCTDSLKAIDELKNDLESIGGKFGGRYSKTLETELKIEEIPVKSWTTKEVCEWAQVCGFEKSVAFIKEQKLDGMAILNATEETLRQIKIPDDKVILLHGFIRVMERDGKFNKRSYIVQTKFSESFPGFNEQEDYVDLVASLSDSSLIKHKFLSTADLSNVNKGGASMSVNQEELFQLEKFDTTKIRVKLVVTEVLQTGGAQKIAKAVSPFLSNIAPNIQKKFEFFHTAVIVGPWFLEWNDSGIVIPKRMIAGRAVISADVDTLVVKKDGLKEISDKISEVIVKWNTKYKYKKSKNSKKRDIELIQGNCQDFVDDILRAIGVQTSFDGALGDFITRMRASGKSSLVFSPCKDFRDFFALEKKTMVFENHRDLDEFCVKIKSDCIDIDDVFSSEWILLKSFDRAFWLRHLKVPDDERYQPRPSNIKSKKPFNTGCPFKDPRETMSYV